MSHIGFILPSVLPLKVVSGLVFLTLILFSGVAFSSERLKVAMFEFAPYEFSRDGQVHGLSVEIVREVFNRSGQAYDLVLLPWSRALLYLEDGRVDALFTVLDNPERREFADFCDEPLIDETVSLFVRGGSPIRYEGLVDTLAGQRFAVRQDFSYGLEYDGAVEAGLIKPLLRVVNSKDLIQALIFDQVDVIIGDRYGIPYIYRLNFIGHPRSKGIRKLNEDLQVSPAYLAFSKKRQRHQERDLFSKHLRDMKRDGTHAAIISRWDEVPNP
ncbi:substrate-binding periplasmic protein [Aestuariispira insulae]|uniref:Amino acid ABC transporter substrate-binding protein (PAAT family) n=1 Tax=Aestuariispira insulae TaxID=1461337 RepID=A0A3D9HQ57_9PROT|nr:transporter substrate-binding domain-containing protein [Aestuariispira insulae]RED51600.1 amino acid ABC transporter substrate-binding protein (PAAT family) [Aestuariispira insulae]